MAMTKFFVYASGQWCEVDAKDGSVSGWREKARFVYCRRGRLEVARTGAVLRGLQALHDGNPTTVRDGPRLPQRRCTKEVRGSLRARRLRRQRRRQLPDLHRHEYEHMHCCTHTHARTCNNNIDITASKPLQIQNSPTANHVKVDASTQAQVSVQVQTVSATVELSPVRHSPAAKRKRPNHTDPNEAFEVTKLKAGSKLRLTKIKTQHTHPKLPKSSRQKETTDSSVEIRKITRARDNKDSDSTDESFEIAQPKKKVKQSPTKRRLGPAKRKRSESSSSDASAIAKSPNRNQLAKPSPFKFKTKLKQRNDYLISSSDSDVVITKETTSNQSAKKTPVKTKTTSKRHNLDSSRSDSTVVISKRGDRSRHAKNSAQLKSTSRRRVSASSSSTVIIAKPEIINHSAKSSPSKRKSRTLKRGDLGSTSSDVLVTKPRRELSNSSTSNEVLSIQEKQSAIQMSNWLAKPSQKIPKVNQQEELCKELIIDESDVEVLRQFLIKYAMDIDIEAFDRDDDYKRMVFYRINPLVNLERCPTIAARLRRQANDEVTLQHFVTKLGLRSITDDSQQESTKYKTRSKIRNANKRRDRSSSDTDKENFKNFGEHKKKFKADGVQNGRIQKKAGPRMILNDKAKRARDRTERDKTATIGSDSDRERLGAVVSKPTLHKQESKNPTSDSTANMHIISKRPSCPKREYSNLEDHAIVSWLSVGGRASRVNGNQLWRELQPLYPRLAGVPRTWHSLRNRYLRYILPALPALYLPLELVARLRAAASTGAIKSKKGPPRRNSIFTKEVGVRGAWSRRPRSPPPPLRPGSPPPRPQARRGATPEPLPARRRPPPEPRDQSDGELSQPRRSLRSSLRPLPRATAPAPAVSSVSPERSSVSPGRSSVSPGRSSVSPGRSSVSPRGSTPPSPPALRPRTPRYSELTRQFSLRLRPGTSLGRSTPPSPQAPQATQASNSSSRGHRKKLFNPKAMPA